MQSRHVDPAQVELGRPPICAACRPHPKDGLYVNVQLPDGYDGRRRFPVLYLLHGSDAQYDFWLHSPRANDPRGGILPGLASDFPGIIVMPDGGADGHYVNWRSGLRGNPAWERYHLEELIPRVERRLRMRRGRRFHAIAGFSMGGYGATFYASQRPGYFAIAAALSARLSLRHPFPWPGLVYALGEYADNRFHWTGHDPVALAPNLSWTRLYTSTGDGMAQPDEAPNPAAAVGEQTSAGPPSGSCGRHVERGGRSRSAHSPASTTTTSPGGPSPTRSRGSPRASGSRSRTNRGAGRTGRWPGGAPRSASASGLPSRRARWRRSGTSGRRCGAAAVAAFPCACPGAACTACGCRFNCG
jgi:S-formylglutathione hydrolase FrmB